MSSGGYSARLNSLEHEINEPTLSLWTRVLMIKYYLAIAIVLWILLFIFPPSFLLTVKIKKKPQRIHWVKWVCAWVLLTVIVCGMYYMYMNKYNI